MSPCRWSRSTASPMSTAWELVAFKPGQRKDDLAQRYLADFAADEGIMFIGVAQEKTWVWGTRKRRNPETGAVFPWLVRDKRVPNQYYFYGVDADFGPYAECPI